MREEPKFQLGEVGAGTDADAGVGTGMEVDSGVGADRTQTGMGHRCSFK